MAMYNIEMVVRHDMTFVFPYMRHRQESAIHISISHSHSLSISSKCTTKAQDVRLYGYMDIHWICYSCISIIVRWRVMLYCVVHPFCSITKDETLALAVYERTPVAHAFVGSALPFLHLLSLHGFLSPQRSPQIAGKNSVFRTILRRLRLLHSAVRTATTHKY